jgi:hypothetical protein
MFISYLLYEYCSKRNKSIIELSSLLHKHPAEVRAWMNGTSSPSDKDLLVISYLFVGKMDSKECTAAYRRFKNIRDMDRKNRERYSTFDYI